MSISIVSDEKLSQDEKVKNAIACDFPGKFLKNFTLLLVECASAL